MKATYQVYRDTAGKFRFRLRAANNKIVAVSEAYERKASGINGVKSVQKNCNSKTEDTTIETEKLAHPKYVVFIDAASKFRFNLSAPNGEIIAVSEGYETKQNCMNGIEAVKNSCSAEIEDLTTGQVTESKKVCPTRDDTAGVTTLEMTCPPESVDLNSIVTFEGQLTASNTCQGIGEMEIGIYERDRSFMYDDMIASGITKKDGSFKIEWKAKQQDWWDDSVEVYARFNGTEKRNPIQSSFFKIRVLFYLKKKD